MPIDFQKKCAVFRDMVSVDEAETLLAWLQKQGKPQVDLSGCEHLHPANLQVLMAAPVAVRAWPADAMLRSILQSALPPTSHPKEQ